MKDMNRKLLSVLLAILMVLSLVPMIFAPKTAAAEAGPIDQAIVQGGAILHCFDWSYNEIRANLQAIKDAGYTAVQTSPVQQPKDYDASYTDSGGQWWKLYQPLGMRIAPDTEGVPTSFLGTKAELKALCDEAEDLGIYVIVDIVANHLANKTGGGYYVDGAVNLSEQVDEEFQDHPEYFHHNTDGVNDGSRYNMTQNQMGMPDLNTSNEFVQQKVLDLLKECVDCGVDGFRFDAAKHIELPNDPYCGSNFWPYVLNGVRDYAGANNLFIYGESLSGSGSDSWVNEYITYMALTDSQAGNTARDAARDQNAGSLAIGTYTRGDSPKDYVIWAESHDTYEDGGSSGVPSDTIVKTWAIVGARANSTALFLARPNEIMGRASADTTWKSTAVAEVNKFKTHYDGTGEYLSYNQDAKITWIERGEANNGAGVVISKLDGAGSVNLGVQWMSDGTYKDEVTGNIFTVSNGTIHGNVGPTGVAVVYKTAEVTPSQYITADPIYFVPTGWWLDDGARFEMWVFNSDGGTFVTLTDADGDGTYEGALPAGNWTGIIFVRMNPNGEEHSWDSKWNQTENLVPDPGTNCFTITTGTSGVWSVYGSGTVSEDAGYYIIGNMTGWSVLPAYKMTRTGAETEEYMFDLELQRTSNTHSQFKVVYSPDGVTKQTWFPDGLNNNYGDYKGEIPVSGIYHVYFRPNYNGGSDWHDGCIYAEQSKYYVSVSDADPNGVVTVDKATAAPGETVNVTVTPHEGYELDTLVYRYETEPNSMTFETVAIEGGSFTMPAFNVTVIAAFKETAKPAVKSHSLVLEGKIGVNFYADLSMLTDEEKAQTYMTFTITGSGSTTERDNFDPIHVNSSGRYGFTCYVTSIQMADTITATLHYGNDKTTTDEYSVRQYIETYEKDKSKYDAQTQALIEALADYGHYVQAFLAEQNDFTLGTNYAEMDKFFTTEYDIPAIKSALGEKGIVRANETNGDIVAITYSLKLNSDVKIELYFKPKADYTGTFTATLDGADYEAVLVGGRYTVEIPNIPANLLGTVHTINVTTENGTAHVEVSALSYAKSMLETYSDSVSQNAAAAIFRYWQAAYNFLYAD